MKKAKIIILKREKIFINQIKGGKREEKCENCIRRLKLQTYLLDVDVGSWVINCNSIMSMIFVFSLLCAFDDASIKRDEN